MKDLRIETK